MKIVPRIVTLLFGLVVIGSVIAYRFETLFEPPTYSIYSASATVVNSLVVTPVPQFSSVPTESVSIVTPPSTVVHPSPVPTAEVEKIVREVRSSALQKPAAQITPEPSPFPTKAANAVVAEPRPIPLELFIHQPPDAARHQPLRVLLVLHGMGSSGAPFSENLVSEADRNGWLLVAPTMPYGDWMDTKQLTDDEIKLSRMLIDTLDGLPKRVNLKLRQHVLIFGFSRGAQLAHRFAFFYPERVESVAMMSAGSYTLPAETNVKDKNTLVLPFPYGVGDAQQCVGKAVDWRQVQRISFWIAVGEKDNRASDVPRAFDPYVGKTRVERAQAFQAALKTIGVDVHLTIFPNADHEITTEMRRDAMQFLHDDELADHWDD